MCRRSPPPHRVAGQAASPAPSAAHTASRSQQQQPTPGGSVMQTPGGSRSMGMAPSQGGTGLRGVYSSQKPTPASVRRPELGYVGFHVQPNSTGNRRFSLAPSVSALVGQLHTHD